jgi:hypothetical protein
MTYVHCLVAKQAKGFVKSGGVECRNCLISDVKTNPFELARTIVFPLNVTPVSRLCDKRLAGCERDYMIRNNKSQSLSRGSTT